MDKDQGTKQRLLRLIFLLLEQPFRYTKKELAQKLNVKPQTITKDFTSLNYATLEVEYDTKYRYGFKQDRAYDQLKNLLHFTEEEQAFLSKALANYDKYGEHRKISKRIEKKLNSLYDYHKLGLEKLRQPNIKKLNMLEKAKNEKRQIYLKGYYSSNSNSVRDRLVEPLEVSPPNDMLYAFDVDKQKLSHFRLSRITKIKETDQPATYRKLYYGQATDPFYIVNDKQTLVHLQFGVAARNELIERFPLTKLHIQPSIDEDGVFDFQCQVNSKFLGISNFILAVHHDLVKILDPPELVEHIQEILKKLEENFRVYL